MMTAAVLIHPKLDVRVCADILALASDVLPVVARGGLVLCGDLYTALEQAAGRLELRGGRGDRPVDEVRDLFAAYLVTAGLAVPEPQVSATVCGWMVLQDVPGVQVALAGAVCFWCGEVDPLASTPFGEGDGSAVG